MDTNYWMRFDVWGIKICPGKLMALPVYLFFSIKETVINMPLTNGFFNFHTHPVFLTYLRPIEVSVRIALVDGAAKGMSPRALLYSSFSACAYCPWRCSGDIEGC
jgi:hypothetical protein